MHPTHFESLGHFTSLLFMMFVGVAELARSNGALSALRLRAVVSAVGGSSTLDSGIESKLVDATAAGKPAHRSSQRSYRRPLKSVSPADARLLRHFGSPLFAASDDASAAVPLRAELLSKDPSAVADLKAVFARSYLVVPGRGSDFERAIDALVEAGRGARSAAHAHTAATLLLPALEHCLRLAFVAVNALPEAMLTAQSAVFFTTLDLILDRFVHSADESARKTLLVAGAGDSKSPAAASPGGDAAALVVNKLWSTLGEPAMYALWDLMFYRLGPRLRDRCVLLSCQVCSLTLVLQTRTRRDCCRRRTDAACGSAVARVRCAGRPIGQARSFSPRRCGCR
jgi:hypothetical protein